MGCGPSKGCPEPGLEHTNLHDLECEFTSGRRAFAKEDYQKAAHFWDAVLRSTPVTKREEGIVALAHGTLGYLFYNGLGVEKDTRRALELYEKGVKLGDTESRTHLADAYLDQNNSFYDEVTAYAWYASVDRYKHESLPEYEEIEKKIIARANETAKTLKSRLKPDQLKRAERLLNEMK